MAPNNLICADVPLRNCSLAHSRHMDHYLDRSTLWVPQPTGIQGPTPYMVASAKHIVILSIT